MKNNSIVANEKKIREIVRYLYIEVEDQRERLYQLIKEECEIDVSKCRGRE